MGCWKAGFRLCLCLAMTPVRLYYRQQRLAWGGVSRPLMEPLLTEPLLIRKPFLCFFPLINFTCLLPRHSIQDSGLEKAVQDMQFLPPASILLDLGLGRGPTKSPGVDKLPIFSSCCTGTFPFLKPSHLLPKLMLPSPIPSSPCGAR